jgi:hypothetical protein
MPLGEQRCAGGREHLIELERQLAGEQLSVSPMYQEMVTSSTVGRYLVRLATAKAALPLLSAGRLLLGLQPRGRFLCRGGVSMSWFMAAMCPDLMGAMGCR